MGGTFPNEPTEAPEKVTVYDYYGTAVYVGDRLAGYFHERFSVSDLCRILGVPFERRSERWEDWPGMEDSRDAVYHPPASLREVETHFAVLAERRRISRIRDLHAELARLEARP